MPHGAWEVIIEFAVILLCPIIYPLYLRQQGASRADAWRHFGWFAAIYVLIAVVAVTGWLRHAGYWT